MGNKSIGLAILMVSILVDASMPAHAQVTNLVFNPSFEEADDVIRNDPAWVKWVTWNDGAAAATVTALDTTEFIDGKQSYRIEPKGGTANWHFLLANMTFPMTAGKTYTTSFWAKAQATRPLTVQMKSGDNNTTWAITDFQLTNQWAEYTFTAASQNAQGKIEFLCGASTVPLWLDFVYVYEGAYIAGILPSGKANPGRATSPAPTDAAADVPYDPTLSWKPGRFAATHDVYLGTAFDDVNNADRSNPLGVLVSEGQDANSFHPGSPLSFGAVYYWRVDEVNAAPDAFVHRGDVWSFTTEPTGYPISKVTAKASSSARGLLPQSTADGTGLTGDLHSDDSKTMWSSGTNPAQPVRLEYDFDKVYKLHRLLVWNFNGEFESDLNFGIKNVTIEYSADGTNFTKLGDYTFAQGASAPDYKYNTVVDLQGVAAKSVKITAMSNYGGTQYGLAEVRFLYIPVWAREPKPTTNSTGINPMDLTLSWRSGREAVSHQVYAGTDPNVLALVGTSPTNSFAGADANLGTRWYWRIDEVNTAGTPPTWTGDVWNFTTLDALVVDDFERYDEKAGSAVFNIWKDGYGTSTNGASVGYLNPVNGTFDETAIVHGGRQSMPLIYSNTGSYTASETTRTFDTAQDWTRHGVKTLTLYFYGQAANATTVSLYVKLTDKNGKSARIIYGAGAGEDAIVLAEPAWTTWNIPLAGFTGIALSAITSVTIGLGDGTGTGTLLIDDIRLRPAIAAAAATPAMVGWWKLNNDAKDSSGAGNHGAIVGTPTFVTAGRIGASLKLNGTTDYVDCGNAAGLNMTDAVTVAAWIKPSAMANGSYQTFVSKGDHAYVLAQTNGNLLQLAIYDGAWYSANSTMVSSTINGSWHHVAGTYDGTQVKLYVDGKMAASTLHTGVIATNSYPLALGTNSEYAASRLFAGEMDDVRVYHGVLSTADIAKLANP